MIRFGERRDCPSRGCRRQAEGGGLTCPSPPLRRESRSEGGHQGTPAAAASMAWASSSVSVSRWRGRTVGIAQVYHRLPRCNTRFGWAPTSAAGRHDSRLLASAARWRLVELPLSADQLVLELEDVDRASSGRRHQEGRNSACCRIDDGEFGLERGRGSGVRLHHFIQVPRPAVYDASTWCVEDEPLHVGVQELGVLRPVASILRGEKRP